MFADFLRNRGDHCHIILKQVIKSHNYNFMLCPILDDNICNKTAHFDDSLSHACATQL